MKEKKLMIMTSFGPVPYDVVKDHLPKVVTKVIDANKEKILDKLENSVPMDIEYYAKNIADRLGWHMSKVKNFIGMTFDCNIAAGFSILLKEVAIELDKKYKDHINNCEELYIISTMDGRIHKVPRAHIKNFRNFAAFRTEEDAKIACRILKAPLKEMFKSVGK